MARYELLKEPTGALDASEPVTHDDGEVPSSPAVGTASWTRFAVAAVLSSVGLLVVSTAYALGRAGLDGQATSALNWCGQLLIVAPMAAVLLMRRRPTAPQALVSVVVLAGLEYGVKLAYSPLAFTFPDELQHWRGTMNVLESGELFSPNYSLPISPRYPALEVVTATLSEVTGLSVFACGVLVAGFAHLLFVGLLFALFLRISGSPRVAALGSLVYATNPHFQFFDSMFIYQGLALAFVGVTLFGIHRVGSARSLRERGTWWSMVLVGCAMVTVSHHVTGYVLLGLLALLTLVSLLVEGVRAARAPALALVAAGAAVAWWLLSVARETLDYLGPAVDAFTGMLSGLFSGQAATAAKAPGGPLLDRVAILAQIATVSLLLLVGWWMEIRRRRRDAWVWTMVLGSASFFAVIGVRLLATNGVELAGRAFSFTFIPVSFVVAVALDGLVQGLARGGVWRAAMTTVGATLLVTAMFAGGIAGGWPPAWERLPGPYQPGGFERAVSPQGIAAAEWMLEVLGEGNRVGVDAGNIALLGAYGAQDTVRDSALLFLSPAIGTRERRYLRQSDARFLFVDRRMADEPPASGRYFAVIPRGLVNDQAVPLSALEKFDSVAGVDRLYDGGDVVVYDLERLRAQ